VSDVGYGKIDGEGRVSVSEEDYEMIGDGAKASDWMQSRRCPNQTTILMMKHLSPSLNPNPNPSLNPSPSLSSPRPVAVP